MTASYFVALTLPQIESCSISAVFLLYGAVRSRIVLKFSHLTCMVSMAYNLTMVTSCIVCKIKRKRDIGRKHIIFHTSLQFDLYETFNPPKFNTNFPRPHILFDGAKILPKSFPGQMTPCSAVRGRAACSLWRHTTSPYGAPHGHALALAPFVV